MKFLLLMSKQIPNELELEQQNISAGDGSFVPATEVPLDGFEELEGNLSLL